MSNDWALFLINDENPLSPCYNVITAEVADGYLMESTAAFFARKMLCCAKKDGINLCVHSAYRSSQYQQVLVDRDIRLYMDKGYSLERAVAETLKNIAAPGRSEHNAGLALDILSDDYTEMDEGFENTSAFRWLSCNAYKFGYILRYPKGKTKITGINYEPWHYRFIGPCHAKKICKCGLTLEEYIKKVK